MTQCLMKIVRTEAKQYSGIGEKIREARKNNSSSQTQLAAKAGISVGHWNRIENEKVKDLPLETLRGIEEALDIDLGVSFDEEEF